MSKWIEERHRRYQEKQDQDARMARIDADARATYEPMFDRLRGQVEQDVEEYNRRFGFAAGAPCYASFSRGAGQFFAKCQGRSLAVSRTDVTVIKIEWFSTGTKSDSAEMLVVGNEHGDIGYKFRDTFFPNADGASEAVLGPILCG